MLATASSNIHAIHDELEEIVADIPQTTSINQGPASISQHSSTHIHCSNPDDLSRVQSFKHFQEYAVGITKDGLYFIADKLERMFPENATRTQVLLGSLNAIQLLRDNGASIITDSPDGTILKFPMEAMPRGFQDPFFSCDPPPPLPSISPPSFPRLYSSPSLSPSLLTPSTRTPPSFGGTSGLLVGANVKAGIWETLFPGKLTAWQVLAGAGVKMFFNGLVVGFVDEVLSSLVPERYKNQLNYMKNLLKGASALIGTSVLVYMIVNKQTALTSAIISVLMSYVCNLLGGTVGAALGKLLQWVKRNYFSDERENESRNFRPTKTPLPVHVDLQARNQRASRGQSEIVHYCGQESSGYMHIGLCINCNVQPAVFGFVHSRDNVAHSAFCLACSALYRKSTCVCCAEVSSTFYFSPATPTCNARTCIEVAPCVTCDEDGMEKPKTASIWRLKKSEETQVTHRTVTLDVRYCIDHFPATSQHMEGCMRQDICDKGFVVLHYFVVFAFLYFL